MKTHGGNILQGTISDLQLECCLAMSFQTKTNNSHAFTLRANIDTDTGHMITEAVIVLHRILAVS